MGKITKRELSPALVQEIDDIKHEIDHLDLSAENVTLDSPDFQSTNVKDGMEELFTNVDSGKNEVAAAIVDMNQPASGSDTFSELAQKIRDISSDATATVGDILDGKTAYARGQKVNGSMSNRGAVNQTITTQNGQYTIPQGYHNGSGRITANFANLVAGNVRQGVKVGGVVGNLNEGRVITLGINIDEYYDQNSYTRPDQVLATLNSTQRIMYIFNPVRTSPSMLLSASGLGRSQLVLRDRNGVDIQLAYSNSYSAYGTSMNMGYAVIDRQNRWLQRSDFTGGTGERRFYSESPTNFNFSGEISLVLKFSYTDREEYRPRLRFDSYESVVITC